MGRFSLHLSRVVKAAIIPARKKVNKSFVRLLLISLVVTANFPFLLITKSQAQGNSEFIRLVRVIETEPTGLLHPAGLAFSIKGNTFHVAGASSAVSSDLNVVKLTPLSERTGDLRIGTGIGSPINMAFDKKSNHLLFLHSQANQLLNVPADSNGTLNPASLILFDARDWGLQDPQGMTIDEGSGSLFILDAKVNRIVRVDPRSDSSFNGANVSEINLQLPGLSAVRGLAWDPVSGHLFLIDPLEQTLLELTQDGEIVSIRDLTPFRLKNPQGITFAPSGDQTDDPSQMSLYVADSGSLDEKNMPSFTRQTTYSQETGQIVEFSLAVPVEPAAANLTSSLVNTINMAAISPPSPDPSGIVYLPTRDTLLIVDGEVEETKSGITHFQGANVWELTRSGNKVSTANISKVAPTVTPMTNEPTDVAFNPGNGHYYVSDDNARLVFDLKPGTDGAIGTADDTWTSFGTLAAGSGDPEGITFNTWNNHIYVVDGVNAEVYEFTTSGALISQFDVQQYGVGDPEGIEFNPDTGTLFIMSSKKSTRIIAETTTAGELLQTIDISVTNSLTAAGLAYAPASDGSGEKRFYIVDRGIDNDDDPNIIDGKVYEITAPVFGSTPTPSATFTATSTLPPSPSPTFTLTTSPTPTFTLTASPTPLPPTPSPTFTRTASPTSLPPSPSPTFTRTASPTPLPPSPSPTFTLTASPTPLPPSPSPTFTRTASPTPLPPSPLPETPTFADVPSSHPYFEYIEALYAAGLTAGCSTTPLSYCPSTNMDRAQMAVFTLRGEFGVGYTPPTVLAHRFSDNWALGPWAEKWAEGMYNANFTAGCATNPLLYCPWQQILREQAAVFALRLKYGNSYTPPPATGSVFADLTDPGYYATKWAEQAYADGLIPGCGTSAGKPRFCPSGLVDRGLGAYIVARAKNLVPSLSPTHTPTFSSTNTN